jgi:DNA-binding MarR family transcriptional regulator
MPVSRAPRRLRKAHERGALRAVVDETVALNHRLQWVAEQMYGDDGRRATRRGLLRGLARYGAQTVPALARARSVTRQNVQPVVDALLAEGLVVLADNPAHARSPLVTITARGARLVRLWDVADARVLAAVGRGLSAADLEITARTLRAVRERFETSLRWRAALPADEGERLNRT